MVVQTKIMTTREKPDSDDFVLDEEIDDYLAELEKIATDVCEDNGREVFDKTVEPALDTGSLNIISKTIMNVLQRRQEHVKQDGKKEVCSSKEVEEVMLGILKNKNQTINQNRNPLQVEVINIDSEKEEILNQEIKTKDLHSMSGSKKKKRKRSSEKDDDSKMNKFTKNDKCAIDDDVMPSVKPFLEVSRCDLVKRRRESDESSLSGMETVILPVRNPRQHWPVDMASKSKINRQLSPLPNLEEGCEGSPFPISKSESDIEDILHRSKLQLSISVPEFVDKSVSTSKAKTEIQKSTPENSKHNSTVLIEQENKLFTLSSKVKRNSVWTSAKKTVRDVHLYEECDVPESTVPVDSTKKRDVVHYGSLSPRGISTFSRSPSPPRKHKKRECDIPEFTVPVDSTKKRDVHYGSLSPRGISTFSRSPSPPRKHKKRECDIPESTVPVDSTKKKDVHYGSLSPRGISTFSRSPSPPRKHKKRKSRSRSPSRYKKRSRSRSRSRSPRNRKSQHKRYPCPQHTSKRHRSRSRERRDHQRQSKSMSISPPPCLRNILNLPVEEILNSVLETTASPVPTVPVAPQVPAAPQVAVPVPIVNSTTQHNYYSYQDYQNQYWQGNYVNAGANYSSYGSYDYQQPFYLTSQEPSYNSYYSYPATTAYSDSQQQHINTNYYPPPPPLPEEQPPLTPPPPPPQLIESTIYNVSRVSKPKPTLLSRLQSNLRYLLPEVTKKQPSPEVIEIINQALESPKKQSSSSPSTSVSTPSIYQYVKKDNVYVQINKPVGSVTSSINKQTQERKQQLFHQKYKPIIFNLRQRNLKNSTDKNDVEKGIMQKSVENVKNKMYISANNKVQSDVSTKDGTSEMEVNAANEINVQNKIKIRKTTRWSRVGDTEMKESAEGGITNNAIERDFKPVNKTEQTEKTKIRLNLRKSLHIDVNTKIIETELKNKAGVDETVPADIVNTELQTKLKNASSSEAGLVNVETMHGNLLENKLKSDMNVENTALIDADFRNENKLGNKVNKEKFMQPAESKGTKTEIELSTKMNKDVEINKDKTLPSNRESNNIENNVGTEMNKDVEINNEIENELQTEINKDKTLPSNTESNNIENNVGTEMNKDVEINNEIENELQTEINKDKTLPSNRESNNIENNVGTEMNKDVEINNEIENELQTEINKDKTLPSNTESNNIENNVGTEMNKDVEINNEIENELQTEINKDKTLPSNRESNNIENNVGTEMNKDVEINNEIENELRTEINKDKTLPSNRESNNIENNVGTEMNKDVEINNEIENELQTEINKDKTLPSNTESNNIENNVGTEMNKDVEINNEIENELQTEINKDKTLPSNTESNNIENNVGTEMNKDVEINNEIENELQTEINKDKTLPSNTESNNIENNVGTEMNKDVEINNEIENELQTEINKDKTLPSNTESNNIENNVGTEMNKDVEINNEIENELRTEINKDKTLPSNRESNNIENNVGTEMNKDVEINNEIENELQTEINKDKTLPSNTESNNIENNVGTEMNKDVEINNEIENELQTEINKDKTLPSNTESNNIENNVGTEMNKDVEINNEIENELRTEINKDKTLPSNRESNNIENNVGTEMNKDVEINNEIENELQTEINKDKTLPSNTESNNIENNEGSEMNKDVEINNEIENELQTEINKDKTLPSNTESNNIENNEGSDVNKDETGVFRNKPETEIPQEESTIDKKIVNKIENEIKSKTMPTIVPNITVVNMIENELNKKEAAQSNVINDKVPKEIQNETKNNGEDCMNTLNTDFKSKLECEKNKEETEGLVVITDGIKNKLENRIMMEPENMNIVNAEVKNKAENAINEEATVDRLGDKFKNDTGNELNKKDSECSVMTDCKIKIEVQDEIDVVESKLEDEQIKNETEKIDIVENEIKMEPESMDVMNVEVESKSENVVNEKIMTLDRMGEKFKNDTGKELNKKDSECSVMTDCKIKIEIQDEMDVVESKLEDEQIKNLTEKINIVENEIRMEPELMGVMNIEVENKSENAVNEKIMTLDRMGEKFKNDTGKELNKKDSECSVMTDCKIKIEVQDEMDVVESKLEDEQIKNETEKIDIVENEIRMEPELMGVMNIEVENKSENAVNEKTMALDRMGEKFKNELNKKDSECSIMTDCKIKIEVQDVMDVVESKLEDEQKKETEQIDIVHEEIKINVRKIEIKKMDIKNTEVKENKVKVIGRMDIIESEVNSKNNTQSDVAANVSEHMKIKLKEDAVKSTIDTRNETEIDKVISNVDNSENLVMKSTKTDTLTKNEIKKPVKREQTDRCFKIKIKLKSDAYQATENLETNTESMKSQMELEDRLNDSEEERKVPKMTRSKSRNKTVALKINEKVADAKRKRLTKSSKMMTPNKEDEVVCTTKVEGSNETCHKDKEIASEEEKKQKTAVSSNIVGRNADVNFRFKDINDCKLLMTTSVVVKRIKLLKDNKFADQGQGVNKSPPRSAQTSNAPCKVSDAVSPNSSESKEQKNQSHQHDVPETSNKSIQQSDADVLLDIARLLNVEQRTVSTQVNAGRNTLKGTVSVVSNKAADKKQINYLNVIERVVKSLRES